MNMPEFQNSYSRIPKFLEFWNIPEFLEFLEFLGQDSWRGILEYSRIPTIPGPGFLERNSGILQNSYYSWARIPGEEFWNIPEFLLFLGQDSWGGIPEYSRTPTSECSECSECSACSDCSECSECYECLYILRTVSKYASQIVPFLDLTGEGGTTPDYDDDVQFYRFILELAFGQLFFNHMRVGVCVPV